MLLGPLAHCAARIACPASTYGVLHETYVVKGRSRERSGAFRLEEAAADLFGLADALASSPANSGVR